VKRNYLQNLNYFYQYKNSNEKMLIFLLIYILMKDIFFKFLL